MDGGGSHTNHQAGVEFEEIGRGELKCFLVIDPHGRRLQRAAWGLACRLGDEADPRRKRNLKMVGGVVQPGGLGDFFPNGDYVGWEEGIKRYFDEEMSAGQRAAFGNSHINYRYEISRKFTEDRGPLEPHECPLEFRMME